LLSVIIPPEQISQNLVEPTPKESHRRDIHSMPTFASSPVVVFGHAPALQLEEFQFRHEVGQKWISGPLVPHFLPLFFLFSRATSNVSPRASWEVRET